MKHLALLLTLFLLPTLTQAATPDGKKKLVLIAGKPSHPPRMHEFRAGSLLLQKSLANVPNLHVDVVDMGWPKDEKILDDADAVVIYADGGKGHPAIQKDHTATLQRLADKGVGIAFMHYGVEVPADKGGPEFTRWIGGYYEDKFSCNPMWAPDFKSFPEHPITRGVKPFSTKDEWYFNIRFANGFTADKSTAQQSGELLFTPVLVATPSDAVRKGPYVYPKGPYPHIVAASGRPEAMMWAVERKDGGRGFGFTGGHSHDHWGNDDQRKVVLNALVWLTKLEVPTNGVESTVTKADLDQNLDPKGKK
jgi:hypothetical protein